MRNRFLQGRIQISQIFTAKGMAVRAVVLIALFYAAHLAGWRACTSLLSGTYAVQEMSQTTYVYLGAVYILLYLGTFVVAPILLITAALLLLMDTARRPAERKNNPPSADQGPE